MIIIFIFFVINIIFANILNATILNNIKTDYNLYSYLYKNNLIYYSHNDNILNLASSLNYQGYDNKNTKISLNNVSNNFFNLPINNISFFSPYFFSVPLLNNSDLLTNSYTQHYIELNIIDPDNLLRDTDQIGGTFYNSVINNLWNIDENVLGYYKGKNIKLFFGLNYLSLQYKNNFNNFNNHEHAINRYNNVLSFEYLPAEEKASIKITNFNFFINTKRDITNNIPAYHYVETNFLKQTTFGNYFVASYKTLFDEQSKWNYYSHIAISNQWISFNKDKDVLTDRDIYYESIDYKIQNIVNFNNVLFNNISLIYGINLNRDVSKNNINNKKFIWPQGVENNYKFFINSKINLFSLNKLYIMPKITYNHSIYSAKNHLINKDSYQLNNISPQLDVYFNFTDNITLYGKYLSTNRLPHIYEKYIDGNFFYNNYFIKFNPNTRLMKQTNHELEGGMLAKFSFYNNKLNLTTDFNIFSYKNKNYIDYKFMDQFNIIFNNIPRAIISGYKVSLGFGIYNLQTEIIYNLITGKDNNGSYLNNLYPENLVIDSSFKFPYIKLVTGVKAKLYNSFNKYNHNYPFDKNRLQGYSLFDIYIEYTNLTENLNFIVLLENISNKKYQLPYITDCYQDRRYFFNFIFKV